jgi:transcriptional regulator with XRE-family HTH domain
MPEVPIHETPGDRLKMLRKRARMSQADLARMAATTQAHISQYETGKRELDRVSVVNQLARALSCNPQEILGVPGFDDPTGRGQEAANELVRQLRRLDLPPQAATHRPLDELAAAIAPLVALRGSARYVELGARTAELIPELHAATNAPNPLDRARAHRLLTHACKEAHSFAYGLDHSHLVELATFRARWNAERADDPLLPALADYMAARDAWTTADWTDAHLLIDRAIATVEASTPADPRAAASLTGALHLRAAITAARANDADVAYGRLDEAETQARLAEGADPYLNWFSAGNVGMHWVAVAVELGDGVEAVRRAGGLRLPKGMPPSRVAHHYMDAARGWIWVNDVERSLASIERAYRIAPQLVSHNAIAQQTVRALVRAERRSTRERLRVMATRLHVE